MRIFSILMFVVAVPLAVLAVMRGDTTSALIQSFCAASHLAYLLAVKE